MIPMKNDDNDNDEDEPFFRIHFVSDKSIPKIHGYWEEYDRLKKSWSRLCLECARKVCKVSGSLCRYHYNKENKLNLQKMRKKTKRLGTKRKIKKQRKHPFETKNHEKIETIQKDENDNMNESLGIVISISSSLNKKQLIQIKEFIKKFHTTSHPVQFTCESQPEYIDNTTTHVITNDCGSFTTILSKEIIQACVNHIFVSSIQWIISSIEQSFILDHFPYEILRDKYSMKNSRGIKQCRFDNLPVFPSSYLISIECHSGIKSLKMTRTELIEIVELSGATLFHDYNREDRRLIVLCNSKKEMLQVKQRNNENNQSLTINEREIVYCKPDFLFNSIVRHEVQIVNDYFW